MVKSPAQLIPRRGHLHIVDSRIAAMHVGSRDLSTTAIELCATLGALGLAQHRVAQLFGVGSRSVRRWRDGERRIPRGVSIVLRLLAAGAITAAQVERVAVLIPARTNGGEPPAPRRTVPSEQSAAETATRAPTTAEKVCALVPEGCRWPYGDPRHSDFRFCGNLAVEQPYCERHRALAYLAPRPGRAHGRQPAHGRPSPPPGSRAALPGHAQLPA